jgi:hypothetical protein
MAVVAGGATPVAQNLAVSNSRPCSPLCSAGFPAAGSLRSSELSFTDGVFLYGVHTLPVTW